MQYLGTSFSLVLGAWRLRFMFALEDDVPERAAQAGVDQRPVHHLVAVKDAARSQR